MFKVPRGKNEVPPPESSSKKDSVVDAAKKLEANAKRIADLKCACCFLLFFANSCTKSRS